MGPEKLFSILNTYQGFTLTLWNFYIAVILGLLVYAIGSEKAQDWSIRVTLAIAFSVFAWGNFSFLERNQILIKSLSEEIASKLKEPEISADLSSAISDWATMQPSSLVILHLLIDGEHRNVWGKRMVKKQQMQWSREGAHYLLQTRAAVLNGELRDEFKQWHPEMRASANDSDLEVPTKQAA